MILFETKYHLEKSYIYRDYIFVKPFFWFTYSSDKMSTLDIIVKNYDKKILLRVCQRQAFEYLHDKKRDILISLIVR